MTRVSIWNFTPYIYKGKCLNVVDGDTIDVEIDLGFDMYAKKRLRLKDVDTPERGEENYNEATQFVRERIEGKDIYMQIQKSDQLFGQYLCSVIYVGKPVTDGDVSFRQHDGDQYFSLNEEVLESGFIKPGTKGFNMHSMLSEQEDDDGE